MYKYFLFDLDGTLTDSAPGITNSVAYALEKLGVEVADRAELLKFVGPPLKDSFREFCHLTEEQTALAVKYYRERYRETGLFENEVYDGVVETLAVLKRDNRRIILATSKPQEFAERILEHFGLAEYFDSIVGSTMDGSRSEKADVIRYALETNDITDLSQALMIGDRKYDITGASQNNIASAGVLYGYGDRAELEAAGADYIVEKPSDITRFLNNIALCVATYNHPETVDDILKRTVKLYDKYGIDIYIFDSSASDDTKKIVESYIAAGAGNLYYAVHEETNTVSSAKAVDILSGCDLMREYEYIFLIKDRIAFDEVTVRRICEESRKGYDCLILPISPYPYDIYLESETRVYTDMAEFFRDYGIYATDWEAVVFRYDTLLKDADWDEFRRTIASGGDLPFLQMKVLYDGLASLNSPKAYALRQNEVLGYQSSYSKSMWTDSKYRVWTTLFSKAVDELPECYDKYKAYVKKKEGMQPGMFGSPYTIIEDARHGVLTRKTMEELKDIWAEVSDIPYECLEYIFDNRIDLVEDSLYKVWNDIFERQEFAKAYHMHSCNIWLESVIGKQVYDTLGKCFEIYKLELSDGKEAGIFKDIHSAEQAADRYDAMAAALKELDAPETKNGKERGDEGADSRDRLGRDAVAYFLKSGLSVEALAYIIENECKDPEYAADRWEKLIGEL